MKRMSLIFAMLLLASAFALAQNDRTPTTSSDPNNPRTAQVDRTDTNRDGSGSNWGWIGLLGLAGLGGLAGRDRGTRVHGETRRDISDVRRAA